MKIITAKFVYNAFQFTVRKMSTQKHSNSYQLTIPFPFKENQEIKSSSKNN